MNCNDATRIIDYIITGKESKSFIRHIEECPVCAKEYHEFMKIKKMASEEDLFISNVKPESIMDKIKVRTKEVSSYPWAIAIIVSLAGIMLVSPITHELQNSYPEAGSFSIVLNLVFGLLISCFIFMYMYTHHDKSKRVAQFLKREHHHLMHIAERSLRR